MNTWKPSAIQTGSAAEKIEPAPEYCGKPFRNATCHKLKGHVGGCFFQSEEAWANTGSQPAPAEPAPSESDGCRACELDALVAHTCKPSESVGAQDPCQICGAPKQIESPAADELPPLDITDAEIKMGQFIAQEAQDYVKMDKLAAEKYAEMASEIECRERQLKSARAEIAQLKSQMETAEDCYQDAHRDWKAMKQRAEYAEGLVAAREAGHKTDLQRIQESYCSGSQDGK